MPFLHLLAGPDGAGKSSYGRDVLTPATALPFVNADEIAAERWPSAQAEHAYEAARAAEAQRRRLMTDGASFITETVFSHPSKTRLVADGVDAGYLVHLHVIVVPVELSVQRVLERVRRGGHSVPEQRIRERDARLWEHLGTAIPLVDVAEVLDNSSARAPFRQCATYRHGVLVGEATWPVWTPEALRVSGRAR